MFKQFTRCYKLSKTLRFELKPVGKTLENIKSSGTLDRDLARATEYQAVKDLLDLEHKALIERVTSRFDEIVETNSAGKKHADWKVLANAYDLFRKSEKGKDERDALNKITHEYRKMFADALTCDDRYEELSESTPSKFFKATIKVAESKGEDPSHAVELFSKFACYFKGFQENRANIYSDEAQATSAANRAINENFPKFLDCCTIFCHLKSNYESIVLDAERELAPILKGRALADVFKIDNYSKVLSQSSIQEFNNIIGGYVPSQGEKIRGINEFINLYRQQHEESRVDRRLAKMPKLFKQILSDRETISFVAEAFTEDGQVLGTVKDFGEALAKNGTVEKMRELLGSLETREGIYIDQERLPEVSKNLFGDWSVLGRIIEEIAETTIKTAKDREKFMRRSEYSIAEFSGAKIPDESREGGYKVVNIVDAWKNDAARERFDKIAKTFEEAKTALASEARNGLRERLGDVALIKNYLDSVQELLHFVKPLHVGAEVERDMEFYGEFDDLFNTLGEIVPLYNRVRNYMTKKNCETEKMKLMFDCPTLADGWDENKEKQNKAILLERGGLYYLGVYVGGKVPDLRGNLAQNGEPCYRKMVYKLLPGPNKMLPKVFFAKNPVADFSPDEELLRRFRAGDYKKGKSFDLQFCRHLIDFFKKSISIHPDWRKFEFVFKPTSSYNGIDEFYREISEQGYKVSFIEVSAAKVDELVESGAMYLFQLYNKDFAPGSNGKMNLHTIYWKMLFDADNLKDVVYKLNGEAELFYRPLTVTKPYVHRVGEKLVNRCDKTGELITDSVFGELFKFANGRLSKEKMSVEAVTLLEAGKVTIKDVKHDIVKDARYAEDKFFFHVPITINANAPDHPGKFNDLVNETVRMTEGVNVIGIDRGERHLLYVTVVDPQGHILEQRSFNTLGHETHVGNVVNFPYHAKLDQVEKARDTARKSWTEIGKIKDLKAGYLSVVVYEIAQLMMKYNAVVVLEDLNFGFKRGRFAIEKQVYQKFEKALIDKLNYLVFKQHNLDEPGGALRGYQLTDKFVSFQRLGKQTGFIYYVPAAYTSKIDPMTGFTNLFDTKKCTNADNIKAFFMAFDSIRYCAAEQSFTFAFDYCNFKTRLKGKKTNWVVYSARERLTYDRNARVEKKIFPTQIILDALTALGESVDDGYDLQEFMRKQEANRVNAAFFKEVFYAFERTLQMRNSCAATGDDYIQSPVKNAAGVNFDSRFCGEENPQNADANGAYHIALKGLWIVGDALKRESKKGTIDLKLDNEEWLRFAQSRH